MPFLFQGWSVFQKGAMMQKEFDEQVEKDYQEMVDKILDKISVSRIDDLLTLSRFFARRMEDLKTGNAQAELAKTEWRDLRKCIGDVKDEIFELMRMIRWAVAYRTSGVIREVTNNSSTNAGTSSFSRV